MPFDLTGTLGLQGGGGFSPGKLRSMLLGVEKKRKEEEELDSNFTPRSQNSDMDESGMYVISCDCSGFLENIMLPRMLKKVVKS